MDALFTSVKEVITQILTLFGTVSTTLLDNSIFQLVMGIIIFGIIMGLVFTLLRKLKRRGK